MISFRFSNPHRGVIRRKTVCCQTGRLNLARLARWLIAACVGVAVLWVYSGRGWGNLIKVLRIPLIDYLLVFALGGVVRVLTLRRTT